MFSRHPRKCACQASLPACDFHPRKRLSRTQWPEITEMPSNFLRRTDNLFQSLKSHLDFQPHWFSHERSWKLKKLPCNGTVRPGCKTNLRWARLPHHPGAGSSCKRLGLFKAWRSPRPSVAILAATETKAFRLLRKLAAYLEIVSEKNSSFATRFLSIGPPNTQNLWPMARRAKASLKPTFTCGICKWQTSAANACWASCSGASSAPQKTNDDEVAWKR